MEPKDQSPSGTPPKPEADGQDANATGNQTESKQVSYDTYRKTVEAEKNAKERARKAEEELESIKKKELEGQNKYKELYEAEMKKADEVKKRLHDQEKAIADAKKVNAIESALGRVKNEKFIRLLPIDDIVLDESGQVDKNSLALVSERIKKEFGDSIFETKQRTPPPSGTPQSGGKPTFKNQKELNVYLKAQGYQV